MYTIKYFFRDQFNSMRTERENSLSAFFNLRNWVFISIILF